MLFPSALLLVLLELSSVAATPTEFPSINPTLPKGALVSKDISDSSIVSFQPQPRARPVTARWESFHEPSRFLPKHKRRVKAAKKSTTACTPLSALTGHISARTTAGEPLGFISTDVNSFGEYSSFTTDPGNALLLSFAPSAITDCTEGAFTVLNGPYALTYPFFALVSGFANTNDELGPGSYNYAYLAGASTTSNSFNDLSGMDRMEQYLSAWILTPGTLNLTANWQNPDTVIQTHAFQLGDTLGITGDFQAFSQTFGGGTEVLYTFVPL